MGFARYIGQGGYAWWYVDALSHDGRFGIALIALIGSVFSPYYALSRRYGMGDPLNHCALNVALYDGRGKRWAMTERGRKSLRRTPMWMTIGPSSLSWDGNRLLIEIDEVTAPFPSRIRGRVHVYPFALVDNPVALDIDGRHWWTPLAPCARVDVDLDEPNLHWAGTGYLDSNSGDQPLGSMISNGAKAPTCRWPCGSTARADWSISNRLRKCGCRRRAGAFPARRGATRTRRPRLRGRWKIRRSTRDRSSRLVCWVSGQPVSMKVFR